ncbi:MAG: PAS domain S-box protein, partial [Planctomycetes bacterium]|nr:PAS domain S-box protein [Planctomycetota bacterium]
MNNMSPEDLHFLKKDLEEIDVNTESFRIGSKIIESKNEVKKYLDSSGVIFVVLNKNAEIKVINSVGCDLFELKEEEIIGKNWFNFCIPKSKIEQVTRWFNDLQNKYDSAVSYLECPLQTKSKHKRIIAWHSSKLLDDDKEISAIILSGEDITDRKSAEKNLLRKEQEFHSLAISIPDIVIRLDINKRFIFINRSIRNYTGKSAEYFSGKRYKDLGISENLCNLLNRTLEWTINTNKPQKVEIIWNTLIGKRFFEIRYIPESINDRSIKSILAIHNDITDRKLAEQKLLVNEKKYQLLIEKAPVGILSLDNNYRIIEANHKFFEIINVCEDDKIAEIKSSKIDKIFSTSITKDITECLNSGITSVNEKPFITNAGMKRQLRYNLAPSVDQNFAIIGVLVILEDVTDKKQMEIELQTEKEKLDVTIQSIGDALISMDIDGKITLMNKLAEELTEWNQSDAIGKHIDTVFKIIDIEHKKKLDVPVKKVLQTSKIIHYSENTTLVSKNSKERYITYTGTPIRDSKNNSLGIVLIFKDITDKIKFEKDLLNTQKLESLGILAGGIAHDFNNILTGVLLNIQLSKLKLDDKDKI